MSQATTRAPGAVVQHRGDRPAPGAEVDRDAGRGQARRRALGEWLALPARDVDAGIDPDPQPAELDRPGDPRQRLARLAPRDHRLEPRTIAGRSGQQLRGLLVGGDEPAAHQQLGQAVEIIRHPHAGPTVAIRR